MPSTHRWWRRPQQGLQRYLNGREFKPVTRSVLSTVTGGALPGDADLGELLVRQVREPVRFSAAAGQLAATADLLIEVGPGRVLSGLAAGIAPDVPVIPLDTDGASLAGVLSATAAAYVLGAPVRTDVLFADRFTRPLPLDKQFRFFASPCESAPADSGSADSVVATPPAGLQADPGTGHHGPFGENDGDQPRDSLQILRRLAAERAELPIDAVQPDSHPLDELHMSSITVGQIMNQAARELGVSAPMVTSAFATATLVDLAQALDELADTALPSDADADLAPEGIGPWVRSFSVELIETDRPARVADQADGTWEIFSPPGHPLRKALSRALRAAELGDGVRAPAAPGLRSRTRRPHARRGPGRAVAYRAVPLPDRSGPARCGRTGQDAAPGSARRAGHRRHPSAGRSAARDAGHGTRGPRSWPMWPRPRASARCTMTRRAAAGCPC